MGTSPFVGIDHLGIVVQDLAAATAAYTEALGLTSAGGEELPARGLAVHFLDTGNARIELIAASRPDSEVSSFLNKRGEGLHHVCLRVRDLESTLATLKARGVRLIDQAPRPGAHGTRVAFVHPKGTHGVLLELVEYPTDRRESDE